MGEEAAGENFDKNTQETHLAGKQCYGDEGRTRIERGESPPSIYEIPAPKNKGIKKNF